MVSHDESHAAAAAPHPGPAHAEIPAVMLQELIDHARLEYPNEACGIIVGSAVAAEGGLAVRFVPTRNAAASPYRYEIDPQALLRLTVETDDRDEVFWGIVHSHVRTAPRPSPTDIGLAFYPEALYILVSLADDGLEAGGNPASPAPSVRAWRIVDAHVHEVELQVIA